MARREIVQVLFTDDMTGEDLTEDEVTEVKFSLDGVDFKLETSQEYADGFRELLAKYIACAQMDETRAMPLKKAAAAPVRTRTAGPRRNTGHTLVMVRAWAQGQGYELGDRGRIPRDIQEAYAAQHGVSVDDLMPAK